MTTIYLNQADDLDAILQSNPDSSVEDYAAQLIKGLQVGYKCVQDLVQKCQILEREESLEKDKEAFSFKIGDQAWLAAPRAAIAQSLSVPEKFLFHWHGPVHIVEVPSKNSTSKSSYTIVVTFPGREIIARDVHVSCLRPFTVRYPWDKAEEVALASNDDFAKELESYKTSVLLRRTPSFKGQRALSGQHLEYKKRWDPHYSEKDHTQPHFVVEKILKFRFLQSKRYQYLIKWEGWQHRHDSYNDEWDLHPDLVAEFWEGLKKTQPREF